MKELVLERLWAHWLKFGPHIQVRVRFLAEMARMVEKEMEKEQTQEWLLVKVLQMLAVVLQL